MAQEHLAVANDSVLRRVPREAAATDPDRTARCSVVSLRWRVRSVVPAAIAALFGRQLMMCRHGLQACSSSPSIGERGQAAYWFEPSRIKRDSEGFRGSTSTPPMLWGSMQGSGG